MAIQLDKNNFTVITNKNDYHNNILNLLESTNTHKPLGIVPANIYQPRNN